MKYGVVGTFGPAVDMVELAVLAENTGWDGFFTWDGISVGAMETFDPWVMLGAVATRTQRITVGAMVFALARRQPWKVAREALTVDQLSGGRLVLPVGLGAVDDAAFSRVSGAPKDRRARAELLDETLEFLEKAWSGETFSYQGVHHYATDVLFQPRPIAQPRIPVWAVAAYPAPKSMARALRWDGALPLRTDRPPMTPLEPSDVREIAAWIAEQRAADQQDSAFEVVVEGKSPTDRAVAAARMAEFADAGATWWIESHWDGPSANPAGLRALIGAGPPGAAG